MSLILIAALALQHSSDFPLLRNAAFDARNADLIDVVAVVRAEGRTASVKRDTMFRGESKAEAYVLDRATVLSALGLSAGKSISIVTSAPRAGEGLYSLIPGKNYFCLLKAPKDGKLLNPVSFGVYSRTAPAQLTSSPAFVTAKVESADEVAGLAVFPTATNELMRGATTEDTIFLNLSECLRTANDAETRRICDFLRTPNARPTDLSGYARRTTSLDTSVTKRFKEVASEASGFKRARILQLLVEWDVDKSKQLFVDALAELAQDASAFTDDSDELRSFSLLPSGNDALSLSNTVALDANRWADVVASAKSVPIQRFFLVNFGGMPDQARLKQVARLIKSPVPEIQLAAANYLFKALKQPDMEPRAEIVDGERRYVNLDEIKAYWIQRLKLDD